MVMFPTGLLFVSLYVIFGVSYAEEGAAALLPKSVHAFMYLWYGNPDTDGKYLHWDHEVLPHWEERINSRYPEVGQRFEPPSNIHSPYYPLYGPYSSNDDAVLMRQFTEMIDSGIEVAVVSWWGQKDKDYATDTQGVNTDEAVANLLVQADKHEGGIKIAMHMEPYPGRSIESIREDLEYIYSTYGHHESLLRSADGRIVFYIYDSYHIVPMYWSRLLTSEGDMSIRGTEIDGVMIGLWLHHHHGRDLHSSGFDGVYSYFGTDGFSYGSTTSNWPSMCRYARSKNMLCNLSVGPGYNDSLIRPWNTHNSRDREEGKYYSRLWSKAIASQADVVSITTYNEWGEGTQIEPARSFYLKRVEQQEAKTNALRQAASTGREMRQFTNADGEVIYDEGEWVALVRTLEEAKQPAFRAMHEGGADASTTPVSRYFEDYGREGPYYYLNITSSFAEKFKAARQESNSELKQEL